MDDILIAMSSSLKDHRDATHDVLDLLQEHNLFLKKKKCRWEVDSIDYLGLILEKGVTLWTRLKWRASKTGPDQQKLRTSVIFWAFATFIDHSYRASPKLESHSTSSHTKISLSHGKTSTKPRSMCYMT